MISINISKIDDKISKIMYNTGSMVNDSIKNGN